MRENNAIRTRTILNSSSDSKNDPPPAIQLLLGGGSGVPLKLTVLGFLAIFTRAHLEDEA